MNRIRVSTDGGSTFILGLLLANGIEAEKVENKEDGCLFGIRKKDAKKCQEVLTSRGKRFSVVTDSSFQQLKANAFKRAGLIAGMVVFFTLMTLYSLSVTRIDISGNELISSEEIEEVIRTQIKFPALKNRIDQDKIKTAVCLLHGVSEASVYLEGNSLFVSVLEELPAVKREEGDRKSLYDALVTKVIIYEGEATVKVGDTVKEGDVLVKGTEDAAARGEVYGRIWLTERIVIPSQRIVTYRTGRAKTYYSFARTKEQKKDNFSCYEVERREVWLNLVIPLKVIETTYYEVEQRQEIVDPESQKEQLMQEAFTRLEARLPEGASEVKKWFSVKTVDKIPVLDLYYEAEVKLND